MKNIVRFSMVALLFLVSLSPAQAVTLTPYYADTPPDFCGPISGDKPCYVASGQYIQCTAKGSQDQYCQLTTYRNGVPECSSVKQSGGCQCSKGQTTGLCQYYK